MIIKRTVEEQWILKHGAGINIIKLRGWKHHVVRGEMVQVKKPREGITEGNFRPSRIPRYCWAEVFAGALPPTAVEATVVEEPMIAGVPAFPLHLRASGGMLGHS